MKRTFFDSLYVILGILSAGFGLKGFLLPNGFIDGGVTGISLLINFSTGVSLPFLIFIINIPFIIIGYKQINKVFAFKTLGAIAGLALCLYFVNYPIITNDKILVAVFGGFFLGAGIGLSVRGGSVIDGTEVLSLYVSRRTGMTIGDVILVFNVIIFSFGIFLLNIETVLYSMLTYVAASRTVNYVIQGIEEYTGVTVVSEKSDEIRKMIIEKMGRGVTLYHGKRGFGKRGEGNLDIDVVFTVVTRLEIPKLKNEIERIDESAFVVTHSINDTKGGMIKKRPLL